MGEGGGETNEAESLLFARSTQRMYQTDEEQSGGKYQEKEPKDPGVCRWEAGQGADVAEVRVRRVRGSVFMTRVAACCGEGLVLTESNMTIFCGMEAMYLEGRMLLYLTQKDRRGPLPTRNLLNLWEWAFLISMGGGGVTVH